MDRKSRETGDAVSLPWPVQAKLEVGAVNDPLEREADRVAEQVMRMGDAGAVVPSAVPGGRSSGLRRKCSCGGTCAKCGTKHLEEEHGEVQRKAIAPQISGMGSAGSRRTAPAMVQEVLRSAGEPLPVAARAFFEPRFGRDLSGIRVHADERAAESARRIHARAYAAGHNIVFGTKQYQPGTVDGRRLLAHELTHSIQQSDSGERGGLAGPVIRSSSNALVMRAPDPPGTPPRTPHPSVMQDIQSKFEQLYPRLSPKARYRLNRNSTIAIGVATEKSDRSANSPRFVYTVASNESTTEIDAVAEELGLTRWNPRARAEGRGTVGAPGDAEQLLTEGAEANHWDLWGAGVNRRVCRDCGLHMQDAEVAVQVFPDTAFRKGGPLYQYVPPAAGGNEGVAGTSGAAARGAAQKPVPKTATMEGEAANDNAHAPTRRVTVPNIPPANDNEIPPPPSTPGGAAKVKTLAEGEAANDNARAPARRVTVPNVAPANDNHIPAPRAPKAPVTAEAPEVPTPRGSRLGAIGVQYGLEAGTIILGFLDAYIKGKLDAKEINKDIEREWPKVQQQITAMLPQIDALRQQPGTEKVYAVIDVLVTRGRVFMPSGMSESVAGVERITVSGMSATEKTVESHGIQGNGSLDSVFNDRSAFTFSVPVWSRAEEQKRKRAQEQAAILKRLSETEKERQKQAPAGKTDESHTPFLHPPGPSQPSTNFVPLPGAPDRSNDPMKYVANARERMQQLLAEAERLTSDSPREQVQAFGAREEQWRLAATYMLNKFKEDGPDQARAAMDNMLHGDDEGGKLTKYREQMGL